MTRGEIKELYSAISKVFEGDYTPEEDLLEYDETFSSDDAYVEALVNIFEADEEKFIAYVDGAKEVLFDFYESKEHLMGCYPEEYVLFESHGLLG